MLPLPDPFPADSAIVDLFGPAADVLRDLVAVSLTGVIFYTPRYDPAGELVDFTFVYLNPAAQRMMDMPERPTRTHREQWPQSVAHGTFGFHVEAFLSGEPRHYEVNYQADGYDNYYRLAARRSGAGLLVSFTDTADQSRTPVEVALRESQAREQQARAEAEAERQRLYEVLLQLPAQVAVYHGPDHVYQFVNPPYQRLFPHCSFVGRPFREGTPEANGLGVVALFDRVYQTGEPYYGHELEGGFDFHGTGEPEQHFFNLYLHPLRNAQGDVDGVLDFSYDVTEQVRARRQVQQLNQELEARVQERTQQLAAAQAATERQRRQWQDLFMRAPAGICIFDGPEWVYEFVNPGYQALFPGRALLGKRLVDALPEVADQPLMTVLHRVYDTGETFEASEVLVPLARTADGPVEDIYFDLTYQVRRNEAGEIDGFVTYANDVTAQVLARREREARQGELQRIFEQAPAAIGLFTGEELCITALNPPMAALFGHPAEQLVGRPLLEALPELQGQGLDDLMRQVQATRVPFVGHEVPITRTLEGALHVIYYNFVYHPLYDAAGQVMGVIDVAVDVTEQVQARQQVERSQQQAQALVEELAAANEEIKASIEELAESNGQLQRTNVDLDNFIYTASHDLKAPISNIEALLQGLLRTLPSKSLASGRAQGITSRMQESVERFKKTIANLTEVVKLQKENSGEAVAVNLAEVVGEVVLDLELMISSSGARLEVDVAGCPTLRFSEKNLRSVVYNLLSNALKYCSAERVAQVGIHCGSTPGYAVLTVVDNGLGMEAGRLDQLFTMFKRFHDHVEGSGIGLYMVKKMVENAGGKIEVESKLGEGSTFRVYFKN